MLEIRDLNYSIKKSGRGFLINNINFELEDGYIMGLVGRNGSGKTTLLNLIYKAITPDSGKVLWNGEEVNSNNRYVFHNDVAYIGNEDWCFKYKSVNENIEMLSLLYKDFDEKLFGQYIKYFELREADRNKKYLALSMGQKMQFQIAFAMARRPKLMLMDEPMANLDPIIKVDLMELLQQNVAKENMSIIISTHLVDDISNMTDYIGLLDNGIMKEFGNREKLFDKYGTEGLREFLIESGKLIRLQSLLA